MMNMYKINKQGLQITSVVLFIFSSLNLWAGTEPNRFVGGTGLVFEVLHRDGPRAEDQGYIPGYDDLTPKERKELDYLERVNQFFARFQQQSTILFQWQKTNLVNSEFVAQVSAKMASDERHFDFFALHENGSSTNQLRSQLGGVSAAQFEFENYLFLTTYGNSGVAVKDLHTHAEPQKLSNYDQWLPVFLKKLALDSQTSKNKGKLTDSKKYLFGLAQLRDYPARALDPSQSNIQKAQKAVTEVMLSNLLNHIHRTQKYYGITEQNEVWAEWQKTNRLSFHSDEASYLNIINVSDWAVLKLMLSTDLKTWTELMKMVSPDFAKGLSRQFNRVYSKYILEKMYNPTQGKPALPNPFNLSEKETELNKFFMKNEKSFLDSPQIPAELKKQIIESFGSDHKGQIDIENLFKGLTKSGQTIKSCRIIFE